MVIALWDKESESYIPVDCVLDTQTNTITAFISHFSRYTILSLPRPASFSLSGLVIIPSNIMVGDSTDISVTITNSGDFSGDYSCNLMVDNILLETRNVTVAAEGHVTLHFSVIAREEGIHSVSVGDLTGSYSVTLTPAAFKVSSLAFSAEEVDIGQDVEVSVIVSNTGQSTGTLEIKLRVNGTMVETKNIMLDGGEDQNVTFTLSANEAGKNMVDINGSTGQFIVKGEVSPPAQIPLPAEETIPANANETPPEAGTITEINLSSGPNWPMISGIAGGCLVLAAGAIYFTWYRRRSKSQSKTP